MKKIIYVLLIACMQFAIQAEEIAKHPLAGTWKWQATNEDGSTEHWTIESMNPRRWDDRGLPRDIAEVGETVSIVGWPARNGKDDMTISAMTTERGTTVILDKVNQPGVRDIVPPPTVKRK